MQQLLPFIEINPSATPTATVICMHGLGANGQDLAGLVPQLGLPPNHSVRFIFPDAPVQPVTLNGGYAMPSWYDIYGLELNTRADEAGVRASALKINALIEHEISLNIPSDRIVLAGFSQGAAMALHCGLRYSKKLGGILAMSGYLPLAEKLSQEIAIANRAISIFMAHGMQDTIVDFSWGKISQSHLEALNYQINFHAYPMSHSICWEEIIDIKNWLVKLLNL